MSEFAKELLALPIPPERAEAARETKKQFERKRNRLKAAIMFDTQLRPIDRVVGWVIADYTNFRTGYAWAGQKYLATKLGFSERNIRKVTAKLTHDDAGWFQRELDGPKGQMNYVYFPRWDRLSPVENKAPHRQILSPPTGKFCQMARRNLPPILIIYILIDISYPRRPVVRRQTAPIGTSQTAV